ncbi:F-box protein CPR1-like [Cornus florida]|uniref:F-box protein CPR1-like n=1 Tax=Cornus florida TaxID=4283 RepID=UPI00289B236D|nr:F-box protein CPR1-like [Cornus florida]
MSELPEDEDAFDDILSRLPVKDLLRFRCVSKRWCALIDSPRFIKLQLNRSIETGTNLSLIVRDDSLYSIDLDVLDDIFNLGGGISSFPLLDVAEFDNPIESESYWTYVEGGSCNGLVCLRRFLDEAIAVLNPSTKEYKILPVTPLSGGFFTFLGIVYDSAGDDYMVVTILEFWEDPDSLPAEVMVFSLKSNMWRRIESFDYNLYWQWDSPRSRSVLVDGALHWLACPDSSELL